MACPSCGSLNAPPGLSWGAGDIAACQGCGHSFVPLGHGLQDGDMTLLRSAVQEMRVQSERAQYLEQAFSRLQEQARDAPRSPPPPIRAGRHAPTAPQGSTRSGPHHRRSPIRRTPPGSPTMGRGPDEADSGQPSPVESGSTPGAGGSVSSQPRLVSLMDTQDLITNSSSGSRDGPSFYGNKLRHHQPSMDTLQNIQQNINAAVYSGGRSCDREEGECTSASDKLSDGEISSSSSLRRGPRPFPRLGGAVPSRVPKHGGALAARGGSAAGRSSSMSSRSGAAPTTQAAKAASIPATAVLPLFRSCALELRVGTSQLVLFIAALALRAILGVLLGAGYTAAGPSLMTGMLSSGAMAAWRSAQWSLEVETQKLFDTGTLSDPSSLLAAALRKAGGVNMRFGGRFFPRVVFTLTIEDSLCLAVSFAQLALLFFFENWGLQGPRAYRWAAVVGHSVASLALLFLARRWLLPDTSGSSSSQEAGVGVRGGGALWQCLTLGHWAATTWAAATWWHSAALTAAEAAVSAAAAANAPVVGGTSDADMVDPTLLYTTLAIHVPIAASAIMHVANIWNASRARKPGLLFVCVILGGISMAGSCCVYCAGPTVGSSMVGWLVARWRASVLPLFCVMSAWVLWQGLVQSLSLD